MQSNGNQDQWQETPAGQEVIEKFSEEKTLHAIERLLTRIDTLEKAVETLSTTMRQGPGLMAMATDTIDEVYRTAGAKGVNIEQRLGTALHLAERITSPEQAEKLDKLIELGDQLPGLIAMVVDTIDENMQSGIAHGFDPGMLRKVASSANDALTNAWAEPPAKVGGIFGILRALKDPDRQKGLGFLMNFLKHFGQTL
jgi:uncharacterized protein DUF1641